MEAQKTYRFLVQYLKRGDWFSVMQTDIEDPATFTQIANAKEYQYRILRDGVDVTETYKVMSPASSV